jgi:hypothetical protein
MVRKQLYHCAWMIAVVCGSLSSAYAQVNGAIFTTAAAGTTVNGNIYDAKSDVYLNGGPQNSKDPGLVPDGLYFFQVTDPSGAVLLSLDDISCRQVVISGGRITGVPVTPPPAACIDGYHNLGTFNSSDGEQPVQLCNPNAAQCPTDFADTPNPGGEYKAWLTPEAQYVGPTGTCPTGNNRFGFCDSQSKTDNFKVKKPNVAYVIVCKFSDLNDNGLLESGEPFIPGWPITATGVDSISGTPDTTVTAQTGIDGCESFSVSDIAAGTSRTVTLTEGTLGVDWTQTAPGNGTYDATGAATASGPTTVSGATPGSGLPASGGVISVVLNPGDTVTAPDFGNFNPNCTTTGACGGTSLVVTKTANPNNKFTWSIQKSVDNTTIDDSSGTATFNYTVTVSHDGGTGWVVNGSITVSNPTPADLTATVTDAVDNGGSCVITDTLGGVNELIEAGEMITLPYTCTYTSMPAPGTNTATAVWINGMASGTAPVSFANAIIDGSVTVTDTLGGALGTVSYTDPSPTTFTYSHTFTGDPAGTCTSHNNTAAFTTNTTATTGSASQAVQQCVGADLTVSKTANPAFTRTYNWTISKSVNANTLDVPQGTAATPNYTVVASETGFSDSAWALSGAITVSNPNNWEAITATVTDSLVGCSVTGGSGVIVPASSSIQVSYTCTFTSGASGTNTATATWSPATAFTPDGTASGSAPFAFTTPTTRVNQSITPTDSFNGGPAATLCSLAAGTPCTPAASDTTPFTNQTYSYTRSISNSPAGTCTSYSNAANTGLSGAGQSAGQTVKVCVGADLQVSKTATTAFSSAITKAVDKTLVNQAPGSTTFNYTVNVTTSGWTVSGNITVTNPNDWESITGSVADTIDNGGSCTVTGGTGVALAAKASVTVPYTCTYSAVPTAGSGANTATASWNAAAFFTPDGAASGTAPYTFNGLTVTDTFNGATNTLGTVTVPPGSATFTYARTVTAPAGTCTTYPNTARIVNGASASQSVTVCVGADLQVSKTAATAFNSAISKSAPATVEGGGSTAALNYTVTVSTSGWTVGGMITVSNPNNWEDITASVGDALSDGGGVCVVNGGANSVTVTRSSSVVLPYSCLFAAQPTQGAGTNTGIASWNPAAAYTTDASAAGLAAYAFNTLTVTDNFSGNSCVANLGTVGVTSTSTLADTNAATDCGLTITSPSYGVFTYSRTVSNSPPGTCAETFNNTAQIVGGPSSNQVTVTVCNTNTGGLTMGFWKNKNGQGIITNFCAGTSGTSLMQYLTGFNPFQDDTATNCSDEATYVHDIVSAAACSSTTGTCNSMLRAQMLATALDVYFSDPALGGNQIGGFNGLGSSQPALGGVAIDLSNVCAIDDTSGGAVCSGTSEDSRPEFGIAPPCLGTTVSQVLSYANYASLVNGNPVAAPPTGATWYLQNKNLQVPAKDGFDNINNQIANIAPAACGPTF